MKNNIKHVLTEINYQLIALYLNIIKKLKNVVEHAKIQGDIVKQQNKRKFMTQNQRSKSIYAYDGQVAQMKSGEFI